MVSIPRLDGWRDLDAQSLVEPNHLVHVAHHEVELIEDRPRTAHRATSRRRRRTLSFRFPALSRSAREATACIQAPSSSGASGETSIPSASATAGLVTLPNAGFTPDASAGSAATAGAGPRGARARAYGHVAFLSA